jgi:RNA polymerase sigma factor (sigma-70 family)
MNDEAGIDSFEALWRRLAPHVRAAVLRYRSRDAALGTDDLVQEVRIRIWNVYSSDTNSGFRASYYYRVVNSAIVDCLRAHRGSLPHASRKEDEDGAGGELERVESGTRTPDAEFERKRRSRALTAALARLPADRSQAVRLFLQGFTIPEIAELLKCDPDRAHNLTYRGVRSLKQQMKSELDDG